VFLLILIKRVFEYGIIATRKNVQCESKLFQSVQLSQSKHKFYAFYYSVLFFATCSRQDKSTTALHLYSIQPSSILLTHSVIGRCPYIHNLALTNPATTNSIYVFFICLNVKRIR